MLAPGVYNLGDIDIGAEGTQVGLAQKGLEGLQAAGLQIRFAPQGTPGTSVKAYLQASLDQGQTWYDVACAAFTAAGTKLFNISALTPKLAAVTPTDAALADDTALDGLLSDRLRVKAVSVGSWAQGTLLSVRLAAR